MIEEVGHQVTLKTVPQMQAEAVRVERDLGWSGPGSPDKSFGDSMMLLVTEVSEAMEAYRNWGLADATASEGTVPHHVRCDVSCMIYPSRLDSKSFTEGGRCTCDTQNHDRTPKPEGVGSEFADVFIRLLTDCQRWGVDLQWEFERKLAYNKTRPYQHGGKRL